MSIIALPAESGRVTVAVANVQPTVEVSTGDLLLTIDSGTAKLIISPGVNAPTNIHVTSGAPGSSIAFAWDAGAGAAKYLIQIHDNTGMRREFETVSLSAIYSATDAVNDGGHKRSYTIKIAGYNPVVGRSDYAELVVENAAPAMPTGIKVTEAMTGFTVSCQNTLEGDYAGMIVWASATAGVTMDDAHKVYYGYSQTAVISWPSPPEAYFVIARYDTFGKTDLNVSSEFTGTLLNNPGLNVVDTLPGTTYLGVDVVYYLADDSLYYWDTDLAPDAYRRALPLVVANQIYSIDLAAISASIGNLNVGQMVVESTGYIQSSNYVAGTSGYKLDDDSIEIKDGTFSGALSAATGSFAGSLTAATGTLGTLTMGSGGYIQSSNYVTGTSGWKLLETGIEFNTGLTVAYADITGTKPPSDADKTVTAIQAGTTITSGGITFSSTATLKSGNYSAGSAGWKLDATGLEINNGTFRGVLSAATGTFAGTLSAATGTFAGTLSAATVTTDNLVINAVSVAQVFKNDNFVNIAVLNTWYNAGTVTITVGTGQTVDIQGCFSANKGNSVTGISIRLMRDAIKIFGSDTIGGPGAMFAFPLESLGVWGMNSFEYSDTPAPGTYTYSMQIASHGVDAAKGAKWRYLKASIIKR
jgi:hypothetical protein